jgi:transcriptional regulator
MRVGGAGDLDAPPIIRAEHLHWEGPAVYIPAPFAESDLGTLHAFMAAHPLATVVTSSHAHGLYATHVPLLLDRATGPFGRLEGHVARANPHVTRVCDGDEALVVFAGRNAYVTPSWYPSKQAHGKVVPTWNHIAVHATGVIRLHHDQAFLLAHLDRLTTVHEASQAHPWAMDDAPASFIEQLVAATVGVTIEIIQLEGKYKLSQNRPGADIDGVVHGLRHSAHAHERDLAEQVAIRKPVR